MSLPDSFMMAKMNSKTVQNGMFLRAIKSPSRPTDNFKYNIGVLLRSRIDDVHRSLPNHLINQSNSLIDYFHFSGRNPFWVCNARDPSYRSPFPNVLMAMLLLFVLCSAR